MKQLWELSHLVHLKVSLLIAALWNKVAPLKVPSNSNHSMFYENYKRKRNKMIQAINLGALPL